MIFTTASNSSPMLQSWMAGKINTLSLGNQPTDAPTVDFCFCDFECEWEEKVFAEVGGTARDYKNDYSSFLFKRLTASDTIEMKLFKGTGPSDAVEIDLLDNADNGEFYDFGAFTNGDYKGYIVEWDKVISLHGTGYYEIRADITILGNASTFISHGYRLKVYSDLIADKTIRFETVQNGNIESSEFDYTSMNWPQSVRIKGKFADKQPRYETDNYLDTTRTRKQIQDSVQNTYTLSTELIPSNISRLLLEDNILANQIFITDYNIMNHEIYRALEVYPEEIEGGTYFTNNTKGAFIIKFTEKKQNRIKRNFN